MERKDQTGILPPSKADASNRSQVIFIGVGFAIVVGGLWLLYDVDGPYHPDIPVTETLVNDTADS